MKVARISEMRNLDQTAVSTYGIEETLLMENAGLATYEAIHNSIGIAGKRFAVICGAGNNGGDGLVVARKIHSNGGTARIVLLSSPEKFKGAARINYEIAVKLKLDMQQTKDDEAIDAILSNSDAVIDAIFGTGLDREVEGAYRSVIERINQSSKPVFAVDIPSGINGDTGQAMGTAINATRTVTFGLPKPGNLLYPGFKHGGRLAVTHISFPPELYDADDLNIEVNQPLALPERPEDGHKGTFGKVLFIAGSTNYLGAPYFSAQSFLKAGGGLSFLATPETVSQFIANKGSEIIMFPQKATGKGGIALKNKDALLEFSDQCDMVVMGPGLSLHRETRRLVSALAIEIKKPLLLDGDGITAVASDPECVRQRTAITILTPHPGEMARLLNQSIGAIQSDRIKAAQEAAADLNAVVVLKGAHSLITEPGGRTYINLSGNAGMATAGSGDVLTGTIAAMLGMGFSVTDAVRMGVFMHGYAGDLAAAALGEDGLVAGDIMQYLPAAVKAFRMERQNIVQNHYNKIEVL